MRIRFSLSFALLLVAANLSAQNRTTAAQTHPDIPLVSFCSLAANPDFFNHRLIQISGFVSHGFEDFAFSDPDCEPAEDKFSLWLMFGGKTQSGTIYCCPGEAVKKKRKEELTVEGIAVPLQEDKEFREFNSLLNKEGDTTIRATVIGRFFAGEKRAAAGSDIRGGFGHFGCCSLLVIQRIVAFDSHSRKDLDYTAEAGSYEEEGCKSTALMYRRSVSIDDSPVAREAIIEQRKNDIKAQSWLYNDPDRVARESLNVLYPGTTPVLKVIRLSPARRVYRWKRSGRMVTVVVTRPYWLSYYAKSSSVIWIASNIKEATCD
jgi:hypothetical protein